jgi:pantetheine-phosphate adenylyltransferase
MRNRIPTAIYAGSFDPITTGHAWVIEQGIELFDYLIIAIGVNPSKKSYFSADERVEMIENYLEVAGYEGNARVIKFENRFLVDVAIENGAHHILRGIRNSKDFEYELELQRFNDELRPMVKTVYVSPPPQLVGTSSSIVRGCVGIDGWESAIQRHTTQYVIDKFKERLAVN